MTLKPYERALANQDLLGLAAGWYNATRIKLEPNGMVRFDGFQLERPGTFATNQYIDLSEQNAVTEAIETIRKKALEDIQNHAMLQALLAKPAWDYDDRATWESHVSKIVSQQHNQIPGLNEYRIKSTSGVTRVTDMKDLAGDVGKTGSYTYEHDCETMRSIEGIVLEQLEKQLLPTTTQNANDYKTNGAYVAVNGGVKYSIAQEAGGHAFLISSLTGNIIEGTSDPDEGTLPYNDTGKDYSYADFVAGKLTAAQNVEFSPSDPSTMRFSIAVYGSYFGEGDEAVVEKRQQLIERGDYQTLARTTFRHDSDAVNEEYFKSAFYKAGEVVFTVSKPTESETRDGQDGQDGQEQTEGERSFKDIIKDKNPLKTNDFDDTFFNKMHKILKDNGFTEPDKPVIIRDDDGKSFLLHRDSRGQTKVYDVTGDQTHDIPVLRFDVEEPEPEPQPTPPAPPEPIKLCTQLHKTSFYELVDGSGILNDTSGYNDANALKDLVQAAKDLGLEESVYGHIEKAMSEQKFLETASAIRAIKAADAAAQKADKNGLSAIDKERSVVKAFFENITAESLILDTKDIDDKTPYSKDALEVAREMARNMDVSFETDKECTVVAPHTPNSPSEAQRAPHQ